MVYVDNYSFFFYYNILNRNRNQHYSVSELPGELQEELWRILCVDVVFGCGHDAHGCGRQLGDDLPGGGNFIHTDLYFLAGMFREDVKSNEAALKYLLLGGFPRPFSYLALPCSMGNGTFYLADLAKAITSNGMNALTYLGMGY